MGTVAQRQAVAQRGKSLEYFTIGWNTLEGLIAVVAGALAGSISLVGFGIDSFIEVTSGTVLLWRMSVDADALKRERNEMLSLRLVGGALAGISNINANIAAMARVLDAQNKQSTCGLYNDDLGY
jgi:hypothetical protein